MNKLGQYFTIDNDLQKTVNDFIKNNPFFVLEPSCGIGHLVVSVKKVFPKIKFDCYEIDKDLDFMIKDINICDFLSQKITKKYPTIIGNPPFVKVKKGFGNLYIEFIDKCVDLLEDGGELVFIIPSTFFRLTSASSILNKMLKLGSFTDIYFPNKENLFKGASIDVVVFRYQLGLDLDIVNYNKCCKRYVNLSNGIITFSKKKFVSNNNLLNYFDVYVGCVSGKEKVFKVDIGNCEYLTDKDSIEKYININSYPCMYDNINNYLIEYKSVLKSRKIRKFNDKNWFEWGALRNIKKIKEREGDVCIYIRNLTRKKIVAFEGKVMPFTAKLLVMIPKIDISVDIQKVLKYLNSCDFKEQYTYSGRFKIGQKELLNVNLSDIF